MSGTALSKTFRLTFTALFIALVLFLGLTPFGLIPLGFINVTLLCVPVAVGCVLLGLKTGCAWGCASAWSACSAPWDCPGCPPAPCGGLGGPQPPVGGADVLCPQVAGPAGRMGRIPGHEPGPGAALRRPPWRR